MIIPVTDKYRIASNAQCWMVQEFRERKSKKDGSITYEWRPIKYAGSINGIVRCLGNLMIRTSEAQTLAEALVEVDRVSTRLSAALTPVYEVRLKLQEASHD